MNYFPVMKVILEQLIFILIKTEVWMEAWQTGQS